MDGAIRRNEILSRKGTIISGLMNEGSGGRDAVAVVIPSLISGSSQPNLALITRLSPANNALITRFWRQFGGGMEAEEEGVWRA